MKYNTYTLDNGLRIIHLPSDSKVVYCGYQINAGTRNEEPGEEGLAHFCEHVTFKGTERRKAWHILNCLESVGGDLNAYTNKEGTVYYSAILKEHIARAVDLLTDIVFHSVYPQAEIDKEVEVICDEIESYNDSPAELIMMNSKTSSSRVRRWATIFWAQPSKFARSRQKMRCALQESFTGRIMRYSSLTETLISRSW